MVVNAGDQAQAMAKLPAAILPVPEPLPKPSAAIQPLLKPSSTSAACLAEGEVAGAGSAGQGKVEVTLLQRRVRLRTTICSNVDRSKAAKEGGRGLNG